MDNHALAGGVYQMELARVFIHDFGDNWVLPELVNGLRNLGEKVGSSGQRVEFEFEYLPRKD